MVIAILSMVIMLGYGGICGQIKTEDDSGSSLLAPASNAPVMAAIGNKTISEGVLLLFTVSATDADNDTLTYAAYSVPAGASFDAAAHTFSWVPTYSQSGTYSVRFRATDSRSLYSEETITITVSDIAAPVTPGGLTAQVAAIDQITLAWQDNSADEAGFKVEQKIGSDGTWTQVTTVNANTATYQAGGLSQATMYYFRVRSYNASGNSAYSSEVSAATTSLNIAPTVMDNHLTNVSHNTASFYGTLNPNGLATTAYFEYGADTNYGTSTTANALGTGTTSANTSADITGLTAGTPYHFRLVATNSAGISYGTDQTFTTSIQMNEPTATTGSASNIVYNGGHLSGSANPMGVATGAYFQWGITTAYGGSSAEQNIASGTSDVAVSADITGLMPETTYHFRVVATNIAYTIFGADQTFVTPAAPTGDVSGTITDSDGEPLEGATVVLGQDSPHAVTDHEGRFTITGVAIGSQPINVICGGFYTLNQNAINVLANATNGLGNIQVKEISDTLDNIPQISDVTAVISGTTITVSAVVTPGAEADAITDVRAELLHYNTGKAMTTAGNGLFSANVLIPGRAVGPRLTVLVFALDAQNRVAQEVVTIAYGLGSGTGGFSVDTIAGPWSGSVKFHRDDIDVNNGKKALREWTNAAVTISGTAVSGKYAEPRMHRLVLNLADPIETVNLDSGTITLVDADIGLYKIEMGFTGLSRTAIVELMARCNSALTPTNLFGIMRMVEIDTGSTITITRHFAGRFHFKKGEAWALSDLTSSWVLSDFIGLGLPVGTKYMPPFQYNEAFSIDSVGNVTTGSNTMGLSITSGSFAIDDASLGKFSGSVVTSDGVTTTFYGLVDLSKRHIKGVKKIAAGITNAYGHFWGPKAPTAHFNTADFASRRISGITINSIFKGHIRVTSGPHIGFAYPVKLQIDASGNVVGGFVGLFVPVVFTSGSVSFVDTTTGQVSGSATGTGGTFTIAPTNTRNASMGVYKARLVGDFKLELTSGGTDTGFFFMHRIPEPLILPPQ